MAPKADGRGNEFARVALPKQFCNLDRLLFALERRGLDGIVATLPYNVFYLSGFNGVAHKADEPRPYAIVLSRHAPGHPILVVADYYLATFLMQPTWVEDIRPFRAVMMPLDLPPNKTDIDRFIPPAEGRHGLAGAGAAQLRLRHGNGHARRLEGPAARSRPAGVRRHGRRLQARHRGHGGGRWLRCADVCPCCEDRHGAAACWSAPHASTRPPSGTRWRRGTRAPHGATSTGPTPAR